MYVWRKSFLAAVAIIILMSGYSGYVFRPLPELSPTATTFSSIAGVDTHLAWPAVGQAAVGTDSFSVLETHGEQKPAPTASVAKVITAMAVLSKKPLAKGETGPAITLTAADVAIYNKYAKLNGSLVLVAQGEVITEYQALQAMMLPSSNNMSDTLAIWAFGSVENYTSYANNYVTQLGMTATHVADASGYAPETVSTASDLVKLGLVAMRHPVMAEIVAQKDANLPVAGTVKNVNALLGQGGIVGIKTGNTDQAGGVFLMAAETTVGSQKVIIISAVMSSPTLVQAMKAASDMLPSIKNNLAERTVVHAGERVGSYTTAEHTKVSAVASRDVKLVTWKGKAVDISDTINPVGYGNPAGKQVGEITVTHLTKTITIPAVLDHAITKPAVLWRYQHPLFR